MGLGFILSPDRGGIGNVGGRLSAANPRAEWFIAVQGAAIVRN